MLPLALDLAARRHHDNLVRDEVQQIFTRQQAVIKQQAASDGLGFETLSQQTAELVREQETLSTKKLHRDGVRKVDLFWSLESNDQMEWAQDQLRALKSLDPQNVCQTVSYAL